ncbi:MAG: aminotransferase class III-fold pyridoxal phosphate-dependent enzyme, partial [Polyangiaceae bacterium]
SLLVVRVAARIRDDLRVDISAITMFEHPTVRETAAAIDCPDPTRHLSDRIDRFARAAEHGRAPIAIVGMACRYPGARTIEELWSVLREGRETVRFFRDEEIDPAVAKSVREDPLYVKARGVLEGADLFDAAFFAIPPKEAEIMDPQQRVLLEMAWEALENAGHIPEAFDGRIGVFAGKYNDTYFSENVAKRPDLVAALGAFQSMVANEKDYVATRIAHKLDLTGPALSIHTACSTSLVAIAQAARSLRSGECDMALAGGIAITVPVESGYMYQEGGMLSNDGHTRSFDARAEGTVFSDGAGLVVLRRLDDALRDGDTIYAVVRGVALNNDGASKASFTAPSVDGQATVIAMAQADAGIDARSVSYVEAHGTATPLGDPIEVEALSRAFRLHTRDTSFCALGSIKSNFGHSVIAAGVAGVIKTALALSRESIPPTLHFEAANPKLGLDKSPFFVNPALTPWPRGPVPRRAGVSSFGVGGTNAHAVLEEAPPATPVTEPRRRHHVLLLSARTPAALDAATRALGEHLAQAPDMSLGDVSFTLQMGRKRFRHRRAVVAADARDAAAILTGDPARLGSRVDEGGEPGVVFMFPGQGAQYVGMGSTLYRDEPSFRDAIDRCAEGLAPWLDRGLRSVLFPDPKDAALAAASLRETRFTQPALFAVGYALAKLWESWGVRPRAMVGHSIGEFVCAVLAGVMSLDDALRLVGARGRMMFDQPAGDMLSVRAPASQMRSRLGPDLALASDNSPSLCVVAGPSEAVHALKARLDAEGIVCKPLQTSHAFHSPMMDPVVAPFSTLVAGVTLSAPRVPFVSTLTGTWITPEEARDPAYWGRHLRETVRFADAVATLWKEPDALLLEVGPRATLATLARQQITNRGRQTAVASLGDRDDAEWSTLLSAVGQLWCAGVPVDGAAFWSGDPRRRIALPTYPFERQRYWIDAPALHAPPCPPPRPIPVPTAVAAAPPASSKEISTVSSPAQSRIPRLTDELRQVFEDASGIEIGPGDLDSSFLDLGLDSLFLTQIALAVKNKTGVKVTFSLLLERATTIRALAEHVDQNLPQDAPSAADSPAAAPASPLGVPSLIAAPQPPAPPAGAGTSLQWVIEQQLQIMAQQLAALQGGGVAMHAPIPAPGVAPVTAAAIAPQTPHAPTLPAVTEETEIVKKPFGAIARISLNAEQLAPKQRARLDALIRRYTSRTKASKQWTQENRATMADPRVVSGFRPAIKELVYPIVMQRSEGARMWDLDGNEYLDTLMGFGCNMFGWQPEFVTKAVEKQLRSGHEIGPQTTLAGECAKLVCEFTGFDRAAFCNTGSEAVMGTMRIARTVTGRT